MSDMRGVAAARQHERSGRTLDLRQDGIDLPEGAVLVVFALHYQDGLWMAGKDPSMFHR